MLVNIEIESKPEFMTKATFALSNFSLEKDFQECLAIICMISGDYYLDPELDLDDLKKFVEQGKENQNTNMTLFISEEGLELEFSN